MATELRDALIDQFLSAAGHTSARLREIADTIDHRAADIHRVPAAGASSAGAVAARIVNTLMWGLANAHVDDVVAAGAEFDRQLAGGDPDVR